MGKTPVDLGANIEVCVVRVLSGEGHDSSALLKIMVVLWVVLLALFLIGIVVGQEMDDWANHFLVD